MFVLNGTILLMFMRARDLVFDPNMSEECVEFLVLTTPVSLHREDFPIEGAPNKTLKGVKDMKHFRFVVNKTNPSMFTKIIDKANITILPSNKCGCRTPTIQMNQL
jgi:hypothetical protein